MVDSVIRVRPPGSALGKHVPETLQRQRIQVVREGLDESGVYAAAFGKRKAGVLSYGTAAVERGVVASARGVSPVHLRCAATKRFGGGEQNFRRYRHRSWTP